MAATLLLVLVTCPTRAVARRIAERLIRERLAACVNVVPGISSVFEWKGRVERCQELLLLIKTTTGRFERLQHRVLALHPYEVPEILALPISRAHPPYAQWVAAALTGSKSIRHT